MRRGITQEQVNEAADAILGTGKNPTVEKIRAALGSGSPNTIIRMLETWRSQFGERLRRLSSLPEVPVPVGQSMIELWRLAVEYAECTLASRFANERVALENTIQTKLAKARKAMEAHRQAGEAEVDPAPNERDWAERKRVE